MKETQISPFPSGSGRTFSFYFPAGDLRRDNAGSPLTNPNIASRAWGNAAGASIGITGAGTGSFVVANGVPCFQFVTTTNAGGSLGNLDNFGIHPIIQKGHAIPPGYNDIACYRVAWTGAFPDNPAVNADYGIEVVFNNNGLVPGIIANTIGGFGFVLRSDGKVALIVQGAGFHAFEYTPAGFDPTKFHTYEMRVISASQTAEATLKTFVDGTPFMQFSWGTGTILPSYGAAGRVGMVVMQNLNTNAIGTRLWTYLTEVAASQTEAGLL